MVKAYPVDKNGHQNGPEREFEDWRWRQMQETYKEFRWVEIKEEPKKKRGRKKKEPKVEVIKEDSEEKFPDLEDLNDEFKKEWKEEFSDEDVNDDLAK